MINTKLISTIFKRKFYNAKLPAGDLRILNIPHGNFEKSNFTSYEVALGFVQNNMKLYTQAAALSPTPLWNALLKRIDDADLSGLEIQHIISLGKIPWLNDKYYDKIRSNALFICGNVRKHIEMGKADYIPIFLSQMSQMFSQMKRKFDVSFVACSSPDKHGYVSLSLAVDCTLGALRNSKHIIGICSNQVPRTFGDSTIHASQFSALIEDNTFKPYEMPLENLDDDSPEAKIGQIIAENLIDDGSTLQFGIGTIPDFVCKYLSNHKDLGIHTELLSSGASKLIEDGIITGFKKTIDTGKHVTSFICGDKNLYEFVDENPNFVLKCSSYTNNVEIVARQPKMTCVNSGIEIDLTGQIASESIGKTFYSGFGGQVDFMTGAGMAYDNKGKAIIAMTSRTPKGKPKIVPTLTDGSGVVTTRAHSKYFVTEYGIANLFGKNVRQRAYELIQISHPDDRENLERKAFERFKIMPSKD
ncbi:Acetyl-CoA hydrolase/transferase family and Acetyl-CoA hydrolase/transferase C-terminal domain-containing protein [Strongyloides ratti]|uniref:Acetyl-CoA hydrolase n=1 Tax=Strongyloides ratti TaxID=34506 RepID=A0A090LUZ2_STRRB|nr:Acetyl-CoA hydrolase/transferase family and Acetyl-CoA hydrolase/transferase C-terminal domain-containing protein [Strongyloides ratti]CEF71469.1 Acetyl-CoA hydrolase/transferase family and Acetyl-CoA hydrolase/transferase C-terminal domain-containing protein [Strongyloides ratti]